jgi:hypothetical protein
MTSPASPPRPIGRLRLGLVGVALAALLVMLGASLSECAERADAVAPPRSPLLPDLVVESLVDLQVSTDIHTGQERLLFSTTLANLGDGPLILEATRAGRTASRWTVWQRFVEPTGGESGVLTPGTMVFGGHGHDHWHLRLGASYVLTGDGTSSPRAVTKAGFCFFDSSPASSFRGVLPSPAFDRDACASPDTSLLRMGLSTGWADPYVWTLEDQFVEVTGLPDGVYRLWAEADPDRWLRESIEGNNATWVDVRLFQGPELREAEVVASAPGS